MSVLSHSHNVMKLLFASSGSSLGVLLTYDVNGRCPVCVALMFPNVSPALGSLCVIFKLKKTVHI